MQQLWGAALTVGYEVVALISMGHGGGALARWRTLHELQVVARVLELGDDATALRFLDREDYRSAKATIDWHRASKDDDRIDQLDPSIIKSAQQVIDFVLAPNDAEIKGDFGWAHPLVYERDVEYRKRFDTGKRANGPRLDDLQALTDLREFVPEYASASMAIHASPVHGTRHLPPELQGTFSGPSLYGLRMAGTCSADAVCDVTIALLESYPLQPEQLLTQAIDFFDALPELVDDRFFEADERLLKTHGLTADDALRQPGTACAGGLSRFAIRALAFRSPATPAINGGCRINGAVRGV